MVPETRICSSALDALASISLRSSTAMPITDQSVRKSRATAMGAATGVICMPMIEFTHAARTRASDDFAQMSRTLQQAKTTGRENNRASDRPLSVKRNTQHAIIDILNGRIAPVPQSLHKPPGIPSQ
jgi:hypothetical protein